ncbi:HAD family hydrolase [Pontibaca salina]|uniref:phosphoglycolate phosphatase n=1 Tax=Pontibaca salina TaxID=2795731 RepID=A0A934HVU6_9RHOB|nr:HAD hydrolase-like protein [Pontibaca salina]MBI6630459.1 HAD family hydrolase [Pontibaca salina]
MIIFDFDGVLADSLQTCLAACHIAARAQGADLSFGADTFATLNPLTFEALAEQHGLNPEQFAQDVAAAVSAADAPSPVFEDLGNTLDRLAGHHDLAVVSASDSRVIRSVLAEAGLDRLFQQIVGGDTAGTKAEKIAVLVAAAPPGPHAMIGDAVSDILAARAAGIGAIAVSWGWQSRAHLAAHAPDAIADTPQQLTDACLSFLAN